MAEAPAEMRGELRKVASVGLDGFFSVAAVVTEVVHPGGNRSLEIVIKGQL